MPKFGDDIGALTAAASMKHFANASGVCTPAGYPHPSSKSTEIPIILERRYVEAGKIEGFRMTAIGDKVVFDNADINIGSMIRGNGVDYEIKERDPLESDGHVTMWILQE